MNEDKTHRLSKSALVESLPVICGDELAAVEFFEEQRWAGKPKCAHCHSERVYKMLGSDGQRNARFLLRCHECKKQFTVRIGTVYEESRIPLRHWAYTFWRAATSKKGVSALEISRHCQISYKSALFLLHRVRFAIAPDNDNAPKMTGTTEIDEVYIGGKPRPGTGKHKRGRGTDKVPVVAMVERGGNVRTKIVTSVNGKNLHKFIDKNIDKSSTVNTDQCAVYHNLLFPWVRHDTVNHSKKEYARHNPDGTVSHVNHAESFFSLIRRGMIGVYHSVSERHLHRYCSEFEFRWNTRALNDGERVAAAVKSATGKRLVYG